MLCPFASGLTSVWHMWLSDAQWAQFYMVMQTDAVVSAAEYAAGLGRMSEAMRAEPQRDDTELPPMLVRLHA